MINKQLNIILKLLFLIILLLFACQPAKSQSPTGAIHPLPTEITLSGRLLDGDSVGEIGIPNAYIFALANDYKTILGYSKTQNGVYPERGSWEITGLPVNSEVKEIILVGFHPNTKFNWVTAKVKTGIFNKDVGDLIIKAGPYHDPEFGGPGSPGLLNLILHEVGVFILDNQIKSLEGLIDYLLNETKKIDIKEIKNVINGLNQALSNKNWAKLRSYCVYGSVAYNGINKKEQRYRDCYNSPNCVVQDHNIVDNINPINISGQYAEAHVFVTVVWILNGEVEKRSSEDWYYLKKIANDWKLYGYSK